MTSAFLLFSVHFNKIYSEIAMVNGLGQVSMSLFERRNFSGHDAVDGTFHRRGSAKYVVADEVTTIRREPHDDDYNCRS
jgi:hypothetical protein